MHTDRLSIRHEWQHNGAWCFLDAFGFPDSRSRLDSSAGGMNGSNTPAVMSEPATVDCSLDAGLVACAEKWRTAVCIVALETATGKAMLVKSHFAMGEIRR